MKKILMPALIVAMGAGAAFATNVANKSSKVIPTYRIDAVSNQCIEVQQFCSNDGEIMCTWDGDGSSQLHQFKLSETTCSSPLTRTP